MSSPAARPVGASGPEEPRAAAANRSREGRLRLTEEEIASIRTCASRVFGAACTVRLFGSRVDDARRGGDIDLHVVAETAALATLDNEMAFVLALEDALGEQRIDVIVRPPGFSPRPIDDVALQTGVVLT